MPRFQGVPVAANKTGGRFGGVQVGQQANAPTMKTPEGKGIAGRIGEDWQERYKTMEDVVDRQSGGSLVQGLWKSPQIGLIGAGQVAGGIVDVAVESLAPTAKYLYEGAMKSTGAIEKFGGSEDFKKRGGKLLFDESIDATINAGAKAFKVGGETYAKFKEKFPDFALAIEGSANMLMAQPIVKGAGKATRYASGKVSGLAESSANKLTEMTLKQPTTLSQPKRMQNIKTAHEGNYLPYQSGVDKLAKDISANELKIGKGIKAGEASNVEGTLDRAKANIEGLRKEANRSSDPIANNALIDSELARLDGNPMVNTSTKGIPISEVQKMKVKQGRELKKNYATDKPTAFQIEIDKARVRGLKEELETQLFDVFPELSKTNKLLGKQYKLNDVLERATSRIQNTQGIGYALPIKAAAGGGLGAAIGMPELGAAIGTAIGVIEHSAVAPRLAQLLYKASKGALTKKQALSVTKQRLKALAAQNAAYSGKAINNMVENKPQNKNALSNP